MNNRWLLVFAAFASGLFLGAGTVWFCIGQAAAPPMPVAAAVRAESDNRNGSAPILSPVISPHSAASAESPAGPDLLSDAHYLITETFTSIPTFKSSDYQAAVVSLIYRLRGLGPAGLQAIGDFLISGQDTGLTEYRVSTGSHSLGLSTLRKALIHSLAEWPDGPSATALSQQILSDTKDMEEAVLAVRTLEGHAPGVYRNEALEALREIVGGQPIPSQREAKEFIEVASHFQASEFMPQLEGLLNQWPSLVNDYFGALAAFSIEERRAAVNRVLANGKVVAEISASPTALKQLDLTDPVMRSQTVKVFATLSPSAREIYLANFGENARFIWGFNLLSQQPQGTKREALQLEQSAKLQLVDAFVPYATTPVLQQRLAEARTQLLKALQQ